MTLIRDTLKEDGDQIYLLKATRPPPPPLYALIHVHKQYIGLTIGQFTQQSRDIDPVLLQWWASVVDGGPAL